MTALILHGGTAETLTRLPLGDTAGRDERWLQRILFEHPELVPIAQMDPGAGPVVPLCREVPLRRATGTAYLDILGVTPQGRLVLIECKLWRNPQARREVVGQILEYAALLRRWSYADLTAHLLSLRQGAGANPVHDAVRQMVPGVSEAGFVDAVSRSLAQGDFSLVIAGDGIRSDLGAVAEMMRAAQSGLSRLALLEIQLWSDPAGRTVLLPALAMRTEVMTHRVVTDQMGTPLRQAEEEAEERTTEAVEEEADPAASARHAANRAFWQRFIETTAFDHPDQPSAAHGGRNWVRIPMPWPARWLTAYRYAPRGAGVFLALRGEDGRRAWEALAAEIDALREETGLPLYARILKEQPFEASIGASREGEYATLAQQDETMLYLQRAANSMVNALRPRLVAIARTMGPQPS